MPWKRTERIETGLAILLTWLSYAFPITEAPYLRVELFQLAVKDWHPHAE